MADEAEVPSKSENTGLPKPASSRPADEIIDAVDKMSIEDLQKPDAGLKMLIAQYKEKCEEGRLKQEKNNALTIKISDLSNKLAVARERLKNVSGTGLAFQFINIIAGAMLAFASALPDSQTRTILYILAILIFAVCAIYYFFSRDKGKDIEESGNTK